MLALKLRSIVLGKSSKMTGLPVGGFAYAGGYGGGFTTVVTGVLFDKAFGLPSVHPHAEQGANISAGATLSKVTGWSKATVKRAAICSGPVRS